MIANIRRNCNGVLRPSNASLTYRAILVRRCKWNSEDGLLSEGRRLRFKAKYIVSLERSSRRVRSATEEPLYREYVVPFSFSRLHPLRSAPDIPNDREIELTKSRSFPVELSRAVCRLSRISAFEFAVRGEYRIAFRRLVGSGKGTVEANA